MQKRIKNQNIYSSISFSEQNMLTCVLLLNELSLFYKNTKQFEFQSVSQFESAKYGKAYFFEKNIKSHYDHNA